MFIGVPLVFHWCSLVFIGVPLVFIGVPLVFIGVHWCSLVFHWCSLVFIGVPLVWCFRLDLALQPLSLLLGECCLQFTNSASPGGGGGTPY